MELKEGKKHYLELLMAVMMLLTLCILAANMKHITVHTQTKQTHIVMIDPGHGGVDPGKVGSKNVLEKDINLSIALKIKDYLEKKGMTVVLTRDMDTGLYEANDRNKKTSDLKARCEKIEETGSELFVSIHQNSFSTANCKGAQVFYHTSSKEGKKLAGIIQQELIETVDKENTRKEKADESYYILKNTSCPAVIVECGFLSNPQEEQLLTEEDYQKKLAEAIGNGIIKFFEKES